MSSTIAIYKAERDAGLERVIRENTRVTLASVARTSEQGRLSARTTAALNRSRPQSAKGSWHDMDLHPINAVLATTGWNGNDDVFDGVEMWAARHTPVDKQLNHEHDDGQIVGHIVSCTAVKPGTGTIIGEELPDDTLTDDLPAKFHLVTGAVLYRHWQTAELQTRMDGIVEEIAKGALGVSMECLFVGFDYAFKSAAGVVRVVARSEKNAHLTKALRAYGGSGTYDGQRIGRLLRNITFSGKGLVKHPANPESVILDVETASASVPKMTAERRLALVQQKTGIPVNLAGRLVAASRALTDEQFVAQVDLLVGARQGHQQALQRSVAELFCREEETAPVLTRAELNDVLFPVLTR